MDFSVSEPSRSHPRQSLKLRRRRQRHASFDFMLKHFQDAWHGHCYRYSVVVDEIDDSIRSQIAGERDRAAEKNRNVESHRLSKHVAEWQQVQDANGL